VPRRQQDQIDEGFGEASRYTAHLDRGWSLLDRGDLQQARNSAHQAMKIRPEVPDGAMLMAAISLAEADPEGSLEWYERAIEADAEYVDAQLAAAQLLLYDLDDPQRALGRAEIARELDEATLADRVDLGLLEVEAVLGLGDHAGAAERLAGLAELGTLEQILSDTSRNEVARHVLEFAGEPPDLDGEDVEMIMGRVVQFAVRVARLHMDLGAPEAAIPWLEGLLRRFGDDSDIWYLANEAAYLAGDSVRAAHAALQVLQLDANAPLPEWSPEPAQLHAKVVELLVHCPDPELRALAREPGFVVIVNDSPPFELVLEGVDPRVRALALAARTLRETEATTPTLTGLALYRRNILRFARDEAAFQRELELAVFDEFAVFFSYDDARRERLGLPASEWPAMIGEPRPNRRDSEPGEGEVRRRLGRPAIEVDAATVPEPAAAPAPEVKAKKAKAGAKKKAAKKPAAKKPAAKKPAAKKPAAKKPATKHTKPAAEPKPKPERRKRELDDADE
jgi:tetratricopeptide (TPR) repeat protein